jgi:microcystin-dependent protein
MSEPFVGEIRMFGGNFAPVGWALCNGQSMSISEYDVLFTLLGTTYGGDGQSTFALPDLRGRIPLHQSATSPLGTDQGTETVTLVSTQLPSHTHAFQGSSNAAGTEPSPSNQVLAQTSGPLDLLDTTAPDSAMAPSSVLPTGGSQAHENMQPFLCVNFIIALYGLFPSQN